jgi:threonine dehydrogenase-like Zn-dependent dehydrogenase
MSRVVTIPAGRAGLLPPDLADFTTSIGEPVCCAVNGIDGAGIRPGDTVVLIGAGYMGLLLVSGLVHTLAGRLIVFDVNPDRLLLAESFGCTEAWDPGSSEGRRIIDGLKAGGGADVVIEASGSGSGFALAEELVAEGGNLVLFAWHRMRRSFDGSLWHTKGIHVLNISPAFDPHYGDRIGQASILIRKGLFPQERLVSHVRPYSRAREVLEAAADRAEGYIKGVVTF